MDATTVTYDELLASLPRGEFGGAPLEHFAIPHAPQVFVPPTLRVEIQEPDAPVTLISARGATGKSTLARQLAAERRVPLWDLGHDRAVSADALHARLRDYAAASSIPGRMSSDDHFIVVDALDEGRLQVSPTSWAEFVGSMVAVAQLGGRPFLMLGRERVLEDLWVRLDDAGIAASWFEISHFDVTQCERYVDEGVLSRLGSLSSPVTDARSSVLAALAGAVPSQESESFVGYAPVLDAVVELLADGNPIAIKNRFDATGADSTSVTVLAQIIGSLLEREMTKVSALVEELDLDVVAAYTPSEQIQWLAAHLLEADEPVLDWCPATVRLEYVDRLTPFIDDHPFRRETGWASPVFSAYVAAKRFGDEGIRDGLIPIGRATGLLLEFVAHLGLAEIIDEWQFAALHASLLAAEGREAEAVVAIEGQSAAADSDAVLHDVTGELVLISDGETVKQTPFVLALDRPDVLSLRGPLAFLSVTFPRRVEIHPLGAGVRFGPECQISCRELFIPGDVIEVQRRATPSVEDGNRDTNVLLEVSGQFLTQAGLAGTGVSRDDLELRVPRERRGIVYPWTGLRVDLEEEPSSPNERAERFLKMFMRLLRRHGREHLGVFDKKLQGLQSIKAGDLQDVLTALESMKVILWKGPVICLSRDWEPHRFDGRGRDGMPSLDDKREAWDPVLAAIADAIG